VLTLGDICSKHARLSGNSEALVFGTTRITYAQLHARSNRLAHALLAQGLAKGDRIAILSENSHRFVECYFGAAKAGLVATPLNFRLTERELLHMLRDSEASAMFVGEGFESVAASLKAQLPQLKIWIGLDTEIEGALAYESLLSASSAAEVSVEVGENDLAVLVYTGGTTGLPKGVMLSHRNLLSAFISANILFKFSARDITLMALPLFHVAFWQVFCHLIAGACVVILRRPEMGLILRTLESERCTNMNAVPTLYTWMIDDPALKAHDLSSLGLMIYSGSPMPEEVLRKCIAKFGPIFAQGYGLTEAAPAVCFLAPQDHELDGPRSRLLKSAGREMTLTEVRIADAAGNAVPIGTPGELLARGPNIMLGYWKNEALTRERLQNGWLRTGDIGVMDDQGYVFLLDRKADMIVTGGENVYPSEVENVIFSHPAVFECIVSSAPDARWGERVQAAVVLKPGAAASAADLIEFCKQKLAGYKCPKHVEFWEQLPKSAVGKLLRKDVKSVFWQGHSRSIN